MKNLIQYRYSCEKAFFEFTNDGEDLDILNHELRVVEIHARRNDSNPKDKELWFKFSDDDTGATGILELLNDLSGANGKANQKFRYEQITECNTLDVTTELRVFYS
jgi:hypothetical protein